MHVVSGWSAQARRGIRVSGKKRRNSDFPFLAHCATADVSAGVGHGSQEERGTARGAMDESWACSAAYVYALHLNPSARAWEYLRRNPHYVRDWMRCRRRGSHGIAARWGLATLVDPRLDARQVVPVWTLETRCLITLVTDESVNTASAPTAAEVFSLWNRSDRRAVFQEGVGLRLILHRAVRTLRLRLGPHLSEGERFACQISAAGAERAAAALSDIHAVWQGVRDDAAVYPDRPGRVDVFHARALQVLDGLAAGATQRKLAIAVFGRTSVAQGWQPDSPLRAQVRYLVRRSIALRDREYRALVGNPSGGVRAEPKLESGVPTHGV